MKYKPQFVFSIVTILLLGAAGLLVVYSDDIQRQTVRLLTWFDGTGALGDLLFVGLYALVVVFILPGILLTTGAGFLFGTLRGSLYVIAGTTIGATAAFLMARFCFSARARRLLEERPQFRTLNQVIAAKPWQIVMLTRMIPFFPFKVSNYAFGMMQVSCWEFMFGTAIGIIPFTVTNVYAGSLLGDLTELHLAREARSPLEWVLYGLGLIILIAMVILVARKARVTLQQIQQEREASKEQA